jgi:hypothetical protein
MSNAYGNTTKLFSTPYLTLAEYKAAPTAIDYNNLVVDSADPAAQDAELANAIARASSWIDTYCGQVLAATSETEQQRIRFSRDGYLKLHPFYNPVVAVTALSYGTQPNNLVAYSDCSQAWVENQSVVVPFTAATQYSSAGPLALGLPASTTGEMFVKYTYVSGYANTTLAANVSAGVATITVADGSGIVAGSRLTIFDGMATESITVASTYTFGSTTVPISGALVFAHLSGATVSALPPAVKEAAILATTAFLKVRGDYSMTMGVTSSVGQATPNTSSETFDLALAKELLIPFRRVR